ncbi:MAG: colicin V production protein [Zetaproteobacteria bacterium CG2_30_46_52]|nr:MAG: colicin V production protein [Zetaproteobacteria bacterium CG2_30_46_52]
MNFFDYILISIVGLSMILSIWRGFVREIIALVGLVLAFLIASRISGDAGKLFGDWIENDSVANIAGFVLVFVLVMVIVGLIGAIIRKLVHMADLSATDRTLGVFFGAARGMLLIGVAFLAYTAYAKADQPWMSKSLLTPYALQLSDWIGKTIPEGYPLSTQGNTEKLSISKMATQAVETVKQQITPEDQEAMKSVLMDALKETNP